jgi:hypothetical protein
MEPTTCLAVRNTTFRFIPKVRECPNTGEIQPQRTPRGYTPLSASRMDFSVSSLKFNFSCHAVEAFKSRVGHTHLRSQPLIRILKKNRLSPRSARRRSDGVGAARDYRSTAYAIEVIEEVVGTITYFHYLASHALALWFCRARPAPDPR